MAKVLGLVSFKVFPAHMGGQKGVVNFYDHLSRHHEVHLAASEDNKGLEEASYPVYSLLHPNRSIWMNLFELSALEQLIKDASIQIIIAEHSYTAWMAWLLQERTGVPFIIHSHNLETYRFRQMNRWWWKPYQLYEGWIHKKAAHNFFIGEEDYKIALEQFELDEKDCSVVPYGVEETEKIEGAAEKLKQLLGLDDAPVLHFNGTMDYEPNMEAVESLALHINPLLQQKGLNYTILISGKRLPQPLQDLVSGSPNIKYVDFVPDINLVYQGSSLFLNPVTNDSGVKTKVIEALANHCSVISCRSGASGVPQEVWGEKMKVSENGDWTHFAELIARELESAKTQTPPQFFEYFYWKGIASKAAATINQILNEQSSS